MINPAIFRKYDIRGIAETDFTDDNVYQCALGFGTYFRSLKQDTVIIGQDVRISSPRIAETIKKGLMETGCAVIDIGVAPTPLLYFSLFHYNIPNGIMITASHNPKEFNGFKIARDKATIHGDEIQHVYSIIEKGEFSSGKGTHEERSIVEPYINYVIKDMHIQQGLKIAIDTGNGTCGPVADRLMKRIKANYTILFKEPDGTFPNHLADPTVPEHITELIGMVKTGDYICGIGFDGDGDRIGILDEKGEIIWGDTLLAIYAEPVLRTHPGAKIIFEVKCSMGLIERLKELGGEPIMYKTGHSLIKAKMKQENSPLAGEMSGHVFFADRYYGYDDALYAALRILEILSKEESLSRIAARVPQYVATPEIRIDMPDETKFQVVEKLKAEFKKSYDVIDIDGVRVNFPDGWGLIRPSNTQPVLVLRFEARSNKRLEEIQNLFYNKLEKYKK